MSRLQQHADEYLRLRRALGFKLTEHGQILPQLVSYLEAAESFLTEPKMLPALRSSCVSVTVSAPV